jgi:hypothetical protein
MRPLLFALALLTAIPVASRAEEWKSLFNGKDLTGWKGKADLWSVKDDAITGYTKDGKITGGNSFLVWDGKVGDFELHAKFKIVGGNSGIQYRSKTVGKPEDFVVGGYQADIDSSGARKNGFLGICYEERGRGFLCNRGTKSWIDEDGTRYELRVLKDDEAIKDVKPNDWNDYVVIAKGNHLIQKINGVTTAEVIDFEKNKRAAEGLLAFQIHSGMGEMTVQFKDIKIKEEKGDILTPATSPIPADAKPVSGPKAPKAKK